MPQKDPDWCFTKPYFGLQLCLIPDSRVHRTPAPCEEIQTALLHVG